MAFGSVEVILGSFFDLLGGSMLYYSTFGMLLGRFPTVTSFLHLWIMAITVVHHSPIVFVTLSRLIDVSDFVSHLFL